jgi:hypothetical protein
VMTEAPRTPGADKTGPVPVRPQRDEIPVQEMEKFEHDQSQASAGAGAATGPASPALSNSGSGSNSFTLANPGAPQVPASPQAPAPVAVGK